jgi:7-carboxy-7-deazaguanine synthase
MRYTGNETVLLNETFVSLQGESVRMGLPTTFFRLTGCPMRCRYCDTQFAYDEGKPVTIAELVEEAVRNGVHHVTVTGGEPLAQLHAPELLTALCDVGFDVSIETGGACSLELVDTRVMIVLDIKTPDSGEMERNLPANLAYLKPEDQIKFVLMSREDYEWAARRLREDPLLGRCDVLFSPAIGWLEPTALAEWIVSDRLDVRFQMQLHKWLWPFEERGR